MLFWNTLLNRYIYVVRHYVMSSLMFSRRTTQSLNIEIIYIYIPWNVVITVCHNNFFHNLYNFPDSIFGVYNRCLCIKQWHYLQQ